MRENGKRSSLGFHNLGREYLNAGFATQDPKRKDLLADHGSFPAYFLLGHAIELFLKSFLLGRGMSEGKLRKRPFGHDLNVILKEARRRKLGNLVKLSKRDIKIISLLGSHYGQKFLEYHREGLYRPPAYSLLAELAKRICDGLYPFAKRITHGECRNKRKKA